MEVSIGGWALWCVYAHNVMVLMSTQNINNDKALVLKFCVGVGALLLLLLLALYPNYSSLLH